MQSTPAPAPALRPLGVGDVLDRTFNVYRLKPLVFIGLSAIWYLVLVIVFVVLAVAVFAGALASFAQSLGPTGTFTPSPEAFAGAITGLIAFVVVAVVVSILLFSAQSGSLIHAGARRYLGKETAIGDAFNAGLRASPRLFVIGMAIFLAIAGAWLALFAVAAIVNQGIVFAIAVCAAIVVAFYLGASWLVAPVIAVVEGTGAIAALGRSWSLADGHRWRIIGIQLLLIVLNIVLSFLFTAIFAFGRGQEPGIGAVIQSLVNLASTIIWAPVQWIAFTVLYYDLRVRKEAFDLQLAAEALPQS